ncbi:glycosyl transferase family 36, partial [candidate division KSB1 bacterium]|nr:glycosyl transferase family 36 [candidate division KSB1 bacterium]
DWNDTLDYLGRAGKGESVWVTMFLAFILRETVALCEFINDEKNAERYKAEYDRVKAAINAHCWDGEWYIRGTNDRGDIIGSAKNSEGSIFLNTQSWAIISGVAEGDRASQCLNSVQKYLDTPKGPKILHPAYTKIDPAIGLATRCVPGKKENGAVFNHPVSWAILAECLSGHGERAFEIYKRALPMNPVLDIERYEVEPYVYAEYVTSPDHPTYGQASHSWLTGSSAWMLRDGMDYILGIRPDYDGLIIDPCIPAAWQDFRVERRFRGLWFDIHVSNPDAVQKGVKEMRIDGKEIAGNKIMMTEKWISESMEEGHRIKVDVLMG